MRPLSWSTAPGFALLAIFLVLVVVSRTSTFSQPLVLVLVLVAAFHVLLLPTSWLPAAALAAHVLIPAPPLPVLSAKFVPSLATAILMVWLVRRLAERYTASGASLRLDWGGLAAPALVGVWLVVSTLASPAAGTSAGWVFLYGTSVLMLAMAPVDSADIRNLMTAWCVVGLLLGAHVIVEFVAQDDLVYGWFYDSLGVPSEQHWSVYRPEASFRHPLSAALFLAAATGVSAGEAVRSGRAVYSVPAAVCFMGTILTVSRSGLLAASCGLALLWLVWTPSRYPRLSSARHIGALAGGLAVAAAATVGPLADRLETTEATRSSETRGEVVRIAWQTFLDQGLFGAGPDRSQAAAIPFNPDRLPIESSVLQVLISVGLVGAVLIFGHLASFLVTAVRAGELGGAAGMASMLVGAAAFNMFEAKESLLPLVGLLVLACRRPSPPPRTTTFRDRSPTDELTSTP